jgi:hypothetical protein
VPSPGILFLFNQHSLAGRLMKSGGFCPPNCQRGMVAEKAQKAGINECKEKRARENSALNLGGHTLIASADDVNRQVLSRL